MRHLFLLTVLVSNLAFGATVKPNQLSPITNSQISSSADLFMLFDASAGATKKILVSELDTRWGGGGSPVTSVTASTPLSSSGGLTPNISCRTATGSLSGCLAAADFTTFAAKQAAGNYITALTGDVTASGPGSVAATVALVGGVSAANVAAGANLANAAASANTLSTIVKRDGSGNFTAGTITAALTGNASTATALAANPSACSAGGYVSDIDANGTLTCSNPFTGMVESYSGHIETVADKTYVIDHYAAYAKQITNIRVKCTSGTTTLALKIGGTNITTCNGISVSSSSATTTCDTGSTNDLAANSELTMVTSSTSSCTDMVWTIKTARD